MVTNTLNGPRFDRAAEYRICVKGQLPRTWSDRLGGMQVSISGRSVGKPITTLTVRLPDQAALRGILNKLWDLNLTLVAVVRVGAKHEDEMGTTGR